MCSDQVAVKISLPDLVALQVAVPRAPTTDQGCTRTSPQLTGSTNAQGPRQFGLDGCPFSRVRLPRLSATSGRSTSPFCSCRCAHMRPLMGNCDIHSDSSSAPSSAAGASEAFSSSSSSLGLIRSQHPSLSSNNVVVSSSVISCATVPPELVDTEGTYREL